MAKPDVGDTVDEAALVKCKFCPMFIAWRSDRKPMDVVAFGNPRRVIGLHRCAGYQPAGKRYFAGSPVPKAMRRSGRK